MIKGFSKVFLSLLLALYVLGVLAQNRPSFILKTDPVLNLNGRWNLGIERPHKGNYFWQTNVSMISIHGNSASSFNNPSAYLMKDVRHQFISLNGFNANVQLRKYVNKPKWPYGAFIGAGVGHTQEVLDFALQSNLTPVFFRKQFKYRSAQLYYISGYQGVLKKRLHYSVAAGLGVRTINKTVPFTFETSNVYSNHLYGIFQVSLMTPVYDHFSLQPDSLKTPASGAKYSIWINPISLFVKGPGLGGGFSFSTKNKINWTLEGWYHRDPFNNFFFMPSQINAMHGVRAGLRKFTRDGLSGYYCGAFGEYNHLEVQNVNFNLPNEVATFTVKDQAAAGLQYGYIFKTMTGIFLDVSGNSGIRVGNQPRVEASNFGTLRMNFNNGTFNKIFLKIGYAF